MYQLGTFVAVAFSIVSTVQFINNSNLAQGVVIDAPNGGSHPIIQFTTNRGQKIIYPQGGLVFGKTKGRSVTVRYDVKDPKKRVNVNEVAAIWSITSFLTILALGSGAMGIVTLLPFIRRRQAMIWLRTKSARTFETSGSLGIGIGAFAGSTGSIKLLDPDRTEIIFPYFGLGVGAASNLRIPRSMRLNLKIKGKSVSPSTAPALFTNTGEIYLTEAFRAESSLRTISGAE